MTRSRKRKLARVGMPFATALIAGGAQAAETATEEGSGGLEEITVTAQKRSEDMQKVPISLTVLSGEKLSELQVTSFDDYAKFLPSVSYISLGPSQSTLYFRGVGTGSDGLHAGAAPSTGTYLDEIPVTTIANNLDVHVYDIQRVEALAGPQGTLYGASSLSGTLRIITNKPDPSAFSAGYDVKADKFGKGNAGGTVEGFVNIPLSDRAAIRLVGYYDYQGGYINNVPSANTYSRWAPDTDPSPTPAVCVPYTGGEVPGTVCPITITNDSIARKRFNDVGSGGGRAALKIDLNDNWSITPTIIAQTQKANGDFLVNNHIGGNLNINDFRQPYNNDQWVQSALTVTGKISNWDVLYTGGWFERKVDNLVDYTQYTVSYDALYFGTAYNYNRFFNNAGQMIDPTQSTKNRDRYTKQNHEFRVNSPVEYRLRGTAGLFYQRQTDDIRAAFDVDNLFVSDGPPPPAPAHQSVTGQPGAIYLSQMDRTDRDYAVFGDVTFDITNKLKVSGGIRKFWVENGLYGFFGYQYYETNALRGCDNAKGVPIVYPVTGNRPCVDTNTKVIADGETHRINLQYQFDPDAMVYTTYSTGYRPGGVNRITTAAPYRADTLTNIEVGWKTAWLDNHLRLNGAIFLEHWKDVQVATQGQYGITSIQNLGKADIKGIESELEWAAADHLLLGISATYVHARTTTDFCTPDRSTGAPVASCAVPDTPRGSQLPITPELKANATARYKFNVGDFESFVQAAVLHQSSTVPSIEGTKNATIGTIPGYTSADFSVGTGKNNWHMEAYIDNAFSSYGELGRVSECGTDNCDANYRSYLIKPMNYGIKFGQKF